MNLEDHVIKDTLENHASLVSEAGDHEALSFINNLKDEPPQPKLKADYVRFYYAKKRLYKEVQEANARGYGHGV